MLCAILADGGRPYVSRRGVEPQSTSEIAGRKSFSRYERTGILKIKEWSKSVDGVNKVGVGLTKESGEPPSDLATRERDDGPSVTRLGDRACPGHIIGACILEGGDFDLPHRRSIARFQISCIRIGRFLARCEEAKSEPEG